MNNFEIKTVIFRGYKSAYIDEGNGEPIIFLHNAGLSHRLFDHQLKHFKKTHRVIALDSMGFGASDKPNSLTYDAFLYIDQLNTLLEHLDIQHFHLVGCCVGGGVAMMFAKRHPEKIKSLTAITVASPLLSKKGMLGAAYTKPGALKYKILRYLSASAIARFAVWPLVMKEQLGKVGMRDDDFRKHCKSGYANPRVGRTFASYNYNSHKELDTETRPNSFPKLLMIWGEKNKVLNAEHGRSLAQRWRADEQLFLKNCGYGVLREQPDLVNTTIERFIHEGDVSGYVKGDIF